MKAIIILLSLLSNLFNLYVNIRVINLFLNTKDTNTTLKKCLVYGAVWMENWMFFFLFNNIVLTPLSMFVGLLTATILLNEGSLIKKITSVVVSFVAMTAIEEGVWFFLPFPEVFSKNATYGTIITSLLSFIVLLILEYFFQINKDIQLPRSSYISIITLFLCSIVLCEVIAYLGEDRPYIATCGLLGISLLNICTLFQYKKITKVYQQLMEQEYMAQRISMYENQFELIRESQEGVRSLQHDFKNHLLLIGQYLKQKDFENAMAYINNIDTNLNISTEYVRTGNNEIDSILNYLLNQAVQMNCKISTKIEVPAEQFMSNVDLNILLSNLLQNAIEATEKVENRMVDIYIRYEKNVLFISIQNTYDGHPNKRSNIFLTTKADKINHGYGLNNIQSVIRKYHGDSSFESEGNLFKANIILYLEEEDQISA